MMKQPLAGLLIAKTMIEQKFYKTEKVIHSFQQWRNRIIFSCGAVVIGIIAAGFAYISDYAQKFFMIIVSFNRFLPIIVCPLLFGLTAWLTVRFCPNSAGSGIPQVIAARSVEMH